MLGVKTENIPISPQNTAIINDGHARIKVTREDDLPIVRFVCIVTVDNSVPEAELMCWEMELQVFRQKSALLPNCVIFGQTSDEPWTHGLRRQALPGKNYASPTTWTNLNERGRFSWVDILLPEEFCGYDGHLVLRRLPGHTINAPTLTIISYMTYEHKGVKIGTPPTRAIVVDSTAFQKNPLGVETIHVCDLFFNGDEIFFPESFQQQLYTTLQFSNSGEIFLRRPEDIVEAEKNSFSVATGRMIMDPIVPFHNVQPAGYIENANTAGRPIHSESLDILMTQRARNKIIELRNRFKRVSSRQRYQHFQPRDIFPLLLCQRDEVAALLKVSTTWLKDRIRAFGINEWPARALMVHSSELRLSLLTLRLLLGGAHGVKARVSAGMTITEDVVTTIKELQADIKKYRLERFAILKDYLTEEFYQEFTRVASIWCLDPNWDAQPPWEYTHADHNLGYGFGRLSVVRNFQAQESEEGCNTSTSEINVSPPVSHEISYL